ncbi:MAG TPA: hypothetical protein VHJ20_16835 [Polyangia bacterium]|nr:hypothetical protein [Polyangia bacterium]
MTARPSAEPFFFGPPERPLFGWLHRSAAPAASLGLVICAPFGYEEICAHRSLAAFADAAAEAGFPAIRFDADGTGNAAGEPTDPGRLAAWVASAGHAADTLRAATGVERVVFLGVRLGVITAALAAARDDVAGLVAIAPVVNAKAHLRELRALQMSGTPRPPPPDVAVDPTVQPVLGFPITAETKASLETIDLAKREKPPAPAVLILDRDDLPTTTAWPEHLAAQGVAVERQVLPGFVEMTLGAEFAVPPRAMIDATVTWLRARVASAATRATTPPALAHEARVTPEVVERIVRVGGVDSGPGMFGVLATPAHAPPRRRGLLLLNAGAVHHVGPNRLHVTLARRWAARGHAVLRLDVSGIGDSPARAGHGENVVYGASAVQDVDDAQAFLRREPGVAEVHGLGICSGGYHAFKAAVAGVRLDGVVSINPLTFFFKAEVPKEERAHQVSSETSRYFRRLRDVEAWKKLFRGDVKVGAFARTLMRRAEHLAGDRARGVARVFGVSVGDDLGAELQTIARHKVALRFLFAAGDPGEELLAAGGGPTVGELQKRGALSVDVIAGPDHTFTPLWSHGVLAARLGAWFDAPVDGSRGEGGA